MGGRGSLLSGDALATEGVRQEAVRGVRQAAEKARRVGVPMEQLDELLRSVYDEGGEQT